MQLRRHAHVVIALALVSAACSGPTRGGDDAAPGTKTSLSTIPGSFHDTVPGSPPTGSPGSPTSGDAAAGSVGTSIPAHSAPTPTTVTTASGKSSPTTTVPTATTVPPGLPPERCPEPKTCRRYGFTSGSPARWRAGSDGRVTIHYRINPSGATSISPEDIEGAVGAAFQTWERAAPALRFVYDGRTTAQATPGDGVNVIAFNGPTVENTTPIADKENHVVEFDMLYGPVWTWAPCQQADNSCTPHDVRTATGAYLSDLQSIATHAAGHALWLTDMTDESSDRYLTMNPGNWSYPPGSRYWSTLALGDVLGIRALYPCSCPLPPIYDP